MNKPQLSSGLSLAQRAISLGMLLLVPFLVTGCSLRGSNQREAPVTTAPITLTIWRQPINQKVDDAAFQGLIDSFKAQYSNVRVDYRSFKADEDYEGAVINALAAGKGPDVWEIRDDELPRHLDKLAPFPTTAIVNTASLNKVFTPLISQQMIHNGKIYGLPLGIDPLVVYINQTHFTDLTEPLSLPKTWPDLVRLGLTMTRKVDNVILRPGLALGTVSNLDRASQIVELLMLQVKTQMVDPAHRKATFHLYNQTPGSEDFEYPAQDALQFFKGFADPQSGYQTWDAGQPYSTEAFINGNLSMMVNYLSLTKSINTLNPDLQYETIPIPQWTVKTIPQEDLPATVSDPVYTGRYKALVASKPWRELSTSDQQTKTALAWQFIGFATSPGSSDLYTGQTGLLSPYLSGTTSSDQSSDSVGPVNAQTYNSFLTSWYKGPSPRTADKVLGEMTKAITEAQLDIPTALAQAAQTISSILR